MPTANNTPPIRRLYNELTRNGEDVLLRSPVDLPVCGRPNTPVMRYIGFRRIRVEDPGKGIARDYGVALGNLQGSDSLYIPHRDIIAVSLNDRFAADEWGEENQEKTFAARAGKGYFFLNSLAVEMFDDLALPLTSRFHRVLRKEYFLSNEAHDLYFGEGEQAQRIAAPRFSPEETLAEDLENALMTQQLELDWELDASLMTILDGKRRLLAHDMLVLLAQARKAIAEQGPQQ